MSRVERLVAMLKHKHSDIGVAVLYSAADYAIITRAEEKSLSTHFQLG